MLKGIPQLISPDLLYILACMGHGDRIVIADEYYPAQSMNKSKRVVYAKGIDAKTIIESITKIMPLDVEFSDSPVRYMVSDDYDKEKDDILPVHKEILEYLVMNGLKESKIKEVKRSEFYKIAKESYATVSTSETSPFGCYILQKGIK